MMTDARVIMLLRIALGGLFLLLIPFELLSLPGQFAHMAETNPEEAHLRWPLTAITVFLVVCVQVVLASTWHLLTLVARDRIFSPAAFAWVNAIIIAIASAWVVLVGMLVWVGLGADDPGPIVVLVLLLGGVSVVGLLMLVMRALLRQATALRADMDAVI